MEVNGSVASPHWRYRKGDITNSPGGTEIMCDMEANAVSLRIDGKGNLGAKPRGEVVADILQTIQNRRPSS